MAFKIGWWIVFLVVSAVVNYGILSFTDIYKGMEQPSFGFKDMTAQMWIVSIGVLVVNYMWLTPFVYKLF